MDDDSTLPREYLDRFKAAIARLKQTRRNEERCLPQLNQRIKRLREPKAHFYLLFGVINAGQVAGLIHDSREQRLIERIRQTRVEAEAAIHEACKKLRVIVIKLSPDAQAEESNLNVFDRLSQSPVTNYEEIVAKAEKLIEVDLRARESTRDSDVFVPAQPPAVTVPAQPPAPPEPTTTADEPIHDERLLAGKTAVNHQIAAAYLCLSGRQIRKLVSSGKLDVVGQGHRKKITTESLRRYAGTPSVEKFGTKGN